jgi:hypothetical protein
MPSHYHVLGVSPHATQDDIRRAYHRLARRHHPDANPGRVESGRATTMAEINAAWAVLGNPEKRRAYDQAIGTAPRPGSAPGPSGVDHDYDYDGGYEDLRHLYDDLVVPRRARPSDMFIMIPVVLAVAAMALFAFSLMSESEGMRTTALFMVPVTAASFVAAPLVTMLRARSRDR